MQIASPAYKQSMKHPFRNRGYIKATIGIVNSDAQRNMTVDDARNHFAFFSDRVFGEEQIQMYATGEQNFSVVDGNMYFLPESASADLYHNGLVTAELFGSVYVSFGNVAGLDIKGLTIDFGSCYPVDFVIEYDEGSYSYTGNDKSYWMTEDVFNGTSYFKITPTKFVNGESRLRIFNFICGIANIFTNENTLSYNFKDYVSPVSEIIPSQDMDLIVDNQDLYYSADNPDSTLAYMEVGQEIEVSFGYDVDGNGMIEWMPPNTCYLKTWSADDIQAKFTATDRFDYLSDTYYRGLYRPGGISLYDLAVDVLTDAGLMENDYFLDPYLKTVVVCNPVPAVSHSEALQIIANAGRCALYTDRRNRIHMQASFVPDMAASSNGETEFSHVENILKNDVKDAYALGSRDFSLTDGNEYFLTREQDFLNTGYISDSIYMDTSCYVECRKESNVLAYFSEIGSRYGKQTPAHLYATGEQDFSRVDGSMYFLPHNENASFYENGFVSGDLYGSLKFEFAQVETLDFAGLQIDFGENYPTEFALQTNLWEKEYTADNPLFVTNDVYKDIEYIIVKPKAMVRSGRLRIFQLEPVDSCMFMDQDRHPTENPVITINLSVGFAPYGLAIRFRNVAPEEFRVLTYYHENMVSDYTVQDPGLEYVTNERFDTYDRLEIIFTKGYHGSRIFVDQLLIGDVTDYTLTYDNDIVESPTGTRQNKVQSINVKRSIYRKSPDDSRELVQEEVVLSPEDNECIAYFANASYDFGVSVADNPAITCEIVENSNYYVRVRFYGVRREITVKYIVTGKEYAVDTNYFIKRHHPNGETISWSNPLVSTVDHARDLEEWLASHYLGDVEYSLKWRGDPRTDANDLFYLELKNREKAMIRCFQNELSFNGAWSGTMSARKAVL